MNRDQELRQAGELLRRGDSKGAEQALRRLVARYPGDADAEHLLALARKQIGDLAGALDLMQASIAHAPRRAEFRANLGNLLRSAGRPNDAEAAYRAALEIDPAFVPARLGLARLLVDVGRHAEAATEAQQLANGNARNAEAWATLGSALAGLGNVEAAEQAYRRSLDLRPDYAVARHNLGALLSQLQRAEEAIVELDRAAAQGLRGREVQFNRARALFDLYRFDDAEAAVLQALAIAPRDTESHVFLAKLRYMRGDPAFARSLEAAIAQFPADTALRMTFGDLLRRAGLLAESEAQLRHLISHGHYVPEVQSALATVLQEQGRFDDAVIEAARAHAGRPNNPAFAENLITVLLCLGRAAEAQPLISAERQRNPLDQRWLTHQATAARILGQPDYERLYDYDRFVRSHELEPPPGWGSIAELHSDLLPILASRHQLRAHPLDQSLRLGTQTARSLLVDPDPVIQAFLSTLRNAVTEYRGLVGRDPLHPFLSRNTGEAKMVGCWSVRLRRGGHHVNHIHPMGWISSAYYVNVPAEVDDTTLRSGWIKFGEPNVATPGCTPARFIQPRVGHLVLFPSYMWHGTTPIHGDEPRVTVAFDVAPI